ncbi:MAG: hypothetical protein ABIU10_01375 [Sphingomicrobium sp.]
MTDHHFPSSDESSAEPDDDPSGIAIIRHDGWTPFLRRLFLDTLAESGRVTRAAEYCRMSPQSAYSLRHRDPVFAASWDAACELARAPLADALYERAVDGVTDVVRRDGEIVAERHRHDSRLSIAVLHRLDKRCDLARLRGARHLALAAQWGQWLDLVGAGQDGAFADQLQSAPHHQLHQLSLAPNPIGEVADDAADDDGWDQIYEEDDGRWTTSFPLRDDDGDGEWLPFNALTGRRPCSARETALLDRLRAAEQEEGEESDTARVTAFFDRLAADLDAGSDGGPPDDEPAGPA